MKKKIFVGLYVLFIFALVDSSVRLSASKIDGNRVSKDQYFSFYDIETNGKKSPECGTLPYADKLDLPEFIFNGMIVGRHMDGDKLYQTFNLADLGGESVGYADYVVKGYNFFDGPVYADVLIRDYGDKCYGHSELKLSPNARVNALYFANAAKFFVSPIYNFVVDMKEIRGEDVKNSFSPTFPGVVHFIKSIPITVGAPFLKHIFFPLLLLSILVVVVAAIRKREALVSGELESRVKPIKFGVMWVTVVALPIVLAFTNALYLFIW